MFGHRRRFEMYGGDVRCHCHRMYDYVRCYLGLFKREKGNVWRSRQDCNDHELGHTGHGSIGSVSKRGLVAVGLQM